MQVLPLQVCEVIDKFIDGIKDEAASTHIPGLLIIISGHFC